LDFKSNVSTNSTTPAKNCNLVPHNNVSTSKLTLNFQDTYFTALNPM